MRNYWILLSFFIFACQTTDPQLSQDLKMENDLLDLVESQDIDAVKDILGFNQDIEKTNSLGQSALHLSAKGGYHEIVALLILRGAQIELQDNRGLTPLHFAITANQSEVIDVLVRNEASLFTKDSQGRHPLKLAIEENIEILDQLISRFNIDQEDEFGNTILHYMAESGRLDFVRMALDRGANPTSKNQFSETALDVALKNQTSDHVHIAAFLLDKIPSGPKDSSYDYFSRFWPTCLLANATRNCACRASTRMEITASRSWRTPRIVSKVRQR